MSISAVAAIVPADEFLHVYPLFGREHVLEGITCWCHPEPDTENPLILIHHADN